MVATRPQALAIDVVDEWAATRNGEAHDIVVDASRPRLARLPVRAFDLVLAIPAVLLAAFPVAVLALLVVATSSGPAFYASERITRDGRRFKMWKLRTMVVDGDRVLADLFAADPTARARYEIANKLEHDPRVTGVGRWLRRLSLDELPQLWNVVRGEMSVVGPRPALVAELERMGAAAATVQQVKSGLTGLWQVSGRSSLTFEERVRLEVAYVVHRNLRRDAAIVARTAWQILRGSPGAF